MSRPTWTPAARRLERDDASRTGVLITDASLTTPDWPAPSAWHAHAPFAFWLVEALSPQVVVELGVYGGFSYFTLCQATALHAPSARLFGVDTWEGDVHAGEIPPGMKRNVEARNALYAPRSTLIASTFDEALDRFADGEIDLLHIDGVHTYEAARSDFDSWLPKMSPSGVVLLHDTEVHERAFGVWRLMDELEEMYPTFRFLHGYGLGVVGVGHDLPARMRALFDAGSESTARQVVREAYAVLGERVGRRHGATAAPWGLGQTVYTGSDWLRETLEARTRMRRAETRLSTWKSSRSWKVTGPLRAAGVAVRRAHAVARKRGGGVVLFNREGNEKREALRRRQYENGPHAYANWIRDHDTLGDLDQVGMAELDASLTARPRISIVMPVYNPDLGFLRTTLDSVLDQVYGTWQLCIADDASTEPGVGRLLASYASRDSRIQYVQRDTNGGIAAAANSALEVTDGDIIVLVDQDDVLRPHALLLVAHRIAAQPELGYVYSDEDVIGEDDVRSRHYLKPDWNPELLRSQDYVCRLAAFRADLVRLVGGFRTEFEGSQNWDLALRIVERLRDDQIGHIPHVLYHRRTVSAPDGTNASVEPRALAAGRAAVAEHLRRLGISGAVAPAEVPQNIRYAVPADLPLVSVVVPTTMKGGRFDALVRGLSGTDYDSIEVVRVAGEATIDAAPVEALVPPKWRARDVPYDETEFNYARATNLGCAAATGPLLLLANDDLEVLHADWLRLMVGHVSQRGVAAVGPLLLYPDETVQHAGALLGAGRGAGHLYVHSTVADQGYANRLRSNQDLSCVTAACMLLRKEAFEEVGGLDETFAVAYNDVDLCIRLRQSGWRIVFTPEAILLHHESASFGSHEAGRSGEYEAEVHELWRRWEPVLLADPAHNPNLALDSFHPWHLAFPPRVQYPWRTGPTERSEDAAAEQGLQDA